MAALIAWAQSHIAILAPLGVALLDFIFALLPNLAANGIVHWIYLQLKALVPK